MKHLLILIALCFSVILSGQMSSGIFSQLKGIEKATINVLLLDETCDDCENQKRANTLIKIAVDNFLDFANEINYIVANDETEKALMADKTAKYWLNINLSSTVTSSSTSYNTITSVANKTTKTTTTGRVYNHYLTITKNPYEQTDKEFRRNGFIVGYRIGRSTTLLSEDIVDIFPLVIKIMNAYIKDGLEYKTLNPFEISKRNWNDCKLSEIQFYRGEFDKKEISKIESTKYKVPIKLLGYNEMLQKIYTQPISDTKQLFIYRSQDINTGNTKFHGNFSNYIDLSTGKVYYKQKRSSFGGYKKFIRKIEGLASEKYIEKTN